MRRVITIFLALLFNTTIFAQVNETQKYNDPQNMDVVMQQEAHYPLGDAELTKLVNK